MDDIIKKMDQLFEKMLRDNIKELFNSSDPGTIINALPFTAKEASQDEMKILFVYLCDEVIARGDDFLATLFMDYAMENYEVLTKKIFDEEFFLEQINRIILVFKDRELGLN